MNQSIIARLVLKDLYLGRWLIAGSLLAGLVSLGMTTLSRVGYFVGSVTLLCVLIILNLFVIFQFVISERRDKTQLFVLSLPVSTTQYTTAKVVSSGLAFLGPWLLLTLGCVAVIHVSDIPDGMIPMAVAVLTYVLGYFCVFLAVALVTEASAWATTVIIIGNVSINFLIPWLMGRPSVIASRDGPVAVWSPDILGVIAAEILVGLLALALSSWLSARNRNFIS
jgi:hypothetical protein